MTTPWSVGVIALNDGFELGTLVGVLSVSVMVCPVRFALETVKPDVLPVGSDVFGKALPSVARPM